MLGKLAEDALNVAVGGFGLVDLVERDDDGHSRRLGVIDRLNRLRHDAVVGRYHQHDDVGHLGAACAHLGERLVAGCVDERDHARVLIAPLHWNLECAGGLRNSAGLARRDVGVADFVQQRCLAVINVTENRDHRASAALVGHRSSP